MGHLQLYHGLGQVTASLNVVLFAYTTGMVTPGVCENKVLPSVKRNRNESGIVTICRAVKGTEHLCKDKVDPYGTIFPDVAYNQPHFCARRVAFTCLRLTSDTSQEKNIHTVI